MVNLAFQINTVETMVNQETVALGSKRYRMTGSDEIRLRQGSGAALLDRCVST
jgi:hypothetical protein